MSVNQDIYSSMKADAGISSIIGSRLYLIRLPQGDLGGDSVSFYTKGDIPEHAHGSISAIKRVELTLNLWSVSTLTLEDLKQAVISFWNAYEGVLGSSYVNNASLVDVGTNYDDETQLYQSVLIIDIQLRN